MKQKEYKKPQTFLTDEQYTNVMNALREIYKVIKDK